MSDLLQEINVGIESNDIEILVKSVEKAALQVKSLVDAVLHAFEASSDRYFIAERLYMFGPCIIEPLRKVYHNTTNQEAKVLAAIVLMRLGSDIESDALLHEVSEGTGGLVCLAAKKLAEIKNNQLKYVIVKRLRTCDISQSDIISCLLWVLIEDLREQLPDDIVHRINTDKAPIDLKLTIEHFIKKGMVSP